MVRDSSELIAHQFSEAEFVTSGDDTYLFTYTFFTALVFFPPVALRPNVGYGLLILEVSRSHTMTYHSR